MSLLANHGLIGAQGEFLMDVIGGGIFAFSLRLVKSGYTGPGIRLRRLSDDAEEDFVFDPDTRLLDFASINTFDDSSGLVLERIYNQLNASEFLPSIGTDDAVFQLDGAVPTGCKLICTANNIYAAAIYVFSDSALWEVSCVVNSDGTETANKIIWASGTNTTNNRNGVGYFLTPDRFLIGKRRGGVGYGKTVQNNISGMCVVYGRNSANTPHNDDIIASINGTLLTETTSADAPVASSVLQIGSTTPLTGLFYEIIGALNNDNRLIIENNQMEFYL